jgi:hypothetical protein
MKRDESLQRREVTSHEPLVNHRRRRTGGRGGSHHREHP